MRSRSSSLEDVTKVTLAKEEPSGRQERHIRHREPPDDTGTIQWNHKTTKNGGSSAAKGPCKEKARDLSRDDLVFLLSLLEGELQVRVQVQKENFSQHHQQKPVDIIPSAGQR